MNERAMACLWLMDLFKRDVEETCVVGAVPVTISEMVLEGFRRVQYARLPKGIMFDD